MDRGELKAKAKQAITGKIGILLVIYLVMMAVTAAVSGLTSGLGAILLAGGLSISLAAIFLAIVNKDKKPAVEDLLLGFKNGNFARGLLGYIRLEVFVLLWSLLFIIPGIVKSFAYSQMFYLMADDPKLDAGAAQKKSMAMMNGHKGELFILQLSFIPWFLLIVVTFGLAAIYVCPYVQATMANYFNYLKKASK
jgi:uncharacterized membrane protein